jgi:hypothetical protein
MAYFVLKLTQESPWGKFQWEVFTGMKSNSGYVVIPKIDDCFLMKRGLLTFTVPLFGRLVLMVR